MEKIKWLEHPEYVEWMISFIPGHSESQIKDGFYDRFGIRMNRSQIKNFKTQHNVKSGTHGGRFSKGLLAWNKGKKVKPSTYEKIKPTMFHKGQPPVNYRPPGSERINVDGYTEVKISDPNKWMLKQRKVWQDHYGEKLTRNDVIVFLDGNKQNFDINNLCKLTRAELVRYNQDHLYTDNPEVSLVAANIARIKTRVKKMEREHHGKAQKEESREEAE